MAFARITDPQPSHDAANTIPVVGTDKNRPTTTLAHVLMHVADKLKEFTDSDIVEYVFARNPWKFIHSECTWSRERCRGGLKWLRDRKCFIQVGRRDGKRLWRINLPEAKGQS